VKNEKAKIRKNQGFMRVFCVAHPYKIDPQSKFFEIDPWFSVSG